MGSTDYLNSAKRAAMAFSLLAIVALGAAGYDLAISLWGGAQVAETASPKVPSPSHRRVVPTCQTKSSPNCTSVEVAIGAATMAP